MKYLVFLFLLTGCDLLRGYKYEIDKQGGISEYFQFQGECSEVKLTINHSGEIVPDEDSFREVECPKDEPLYCYKAEDKAKIEGWIKTAVEQYKTQ